MKIKQFIRYLDYYCPVFLSKVVRKYHDRHKINEIKKRYKRFTITKEEVTNIINGLDLNCDVFLHSSMTSIGKIDGGTKFLCNLIQNKVNTEKHTLLVSALPFRGRMKEYLETNPVFDVRTAPVEMGMINEYFSLYPNTKRSLHPTHSVVAIGPDADYYTSEHHKDDTPFGKRSPYYKLIEKKAKILMFGAGINYLTFIHVVEDIFKDSYPVNPYYRKKYQVEVVDTDENCLTVNTPCHDPIKALKRDVSYLVPYFLNYKAMKKYDIGDSEILLLDVKLILFASCKALLDGVSIYGKFRLKDNLKKQVLHLLDDLKRYCE